MKKLMLLALTALALSGCLNPPGRSLSNQALLARANEVAPYLLNYDTVWTCAGRLSEASNEFIAVAVQSDPNSSELYLAVNRIILSEDGGTYSRYGVYLGEVLPIATADIPFVIYKQKLGAAKLTAEDKDTVASYDFQAQNVVLNVMKFNNSPLSISCKDGRLSY